MIENLDWNCGRIVETLEQNGLQESTHVLFFADHGDMHGSHGMLFETNPCEEAISQARNGCARRPAGPTQIARLPLLAMCWSASRVHETAKFRAGVAP
ncbi:hypothetical protein SBA3_250014 [Candidatus Sulfopaludibacter sp. SbA3]|nr:hypothetical protein SBA3_250014 [Candidatus Sulfopaludibacter sp. SbA3]